MPTDLRLALRRLRRAPGFTAIAVLTIALAIGANTAILGVADAVLFRPLGYGDADRLRIIRMQDRATGQRYYRIPPEFLDAIEREHGGVSAIGYLESGSLLDRSDNAAVTVPTASVSENYFDILDVTAHRGRYFTEGDTERGGRPAVLSHFTWQNRFAGDESVIGGPVRIAGVTWDVLGVLPPGFTFPSPFAESPEFVTLLAPRSATEGAFYPIVRLEEGVTAAQAKLELDAIAARVTVDDPTTGATVPVLDDVRAAVYSTGRPIMVFLLTAAGLVLLIACANLANLFMAAARRRERETGVAGALGAGHVRLIRPVVLETALIGAMGATLALVVTSLGFDFLIGLIPREAYGDARIGVDARVAGFALGMGALAGLLTAIVPAWRVARLDPHTVIMNASRSGGATRLGFGRPMVAVQVALAVVIVFGAAIATRAFVSVLLVPLGVETGSVALIDVRAPSGDGAERQAFYERVVESLAARPDVLEAGATGSVPVVRGIAWGPASAAGGSVESASIVHVLPGWFETAGIAVREGRTIERADADAAVISESAARTLFASSDPVGSVVFGPGGRAYTVVGIVADVRMSIDDDRLPPVYVLPGEDTRGMTVAVRTRTTEPALLASLHRDVAELAPGSTVTVRWWSDAIAALTPYRNPRFQSVVLGAFALLALAVSALGIAGVIAFTLALRKREMGIRLALGVAPRGLVGLMMRYALAPVAVGLLAGLLATRVLAGLAEAQLFDVETADPATLAATALTVLLSAAMAAWLPARRAARLDPISTLRPD